MTPPSGAGPITSGRGFDRLAPFYDLGTDLLLFGQVHRSQLALLPRLPPVKRALLVGGGTGRFLAALLAAHPGLRAVSIDASAAMTRRTAARLAPEQAARVELRVGSLECLAEGERFDLVVTHCFLDLFDEAGLVPVMARLERALAEGGCWLFSDFADSGPGLPLRRTVVAMLYAFFRLTCAIPARRLPDFDAAFARHGLREQESVRFLGGLLRATLLHRRRGPCGLLQVGRLDHL
jgi:ubiquinone/menaquinone biosynthesis C-methylase UbiE